MYDHLETARENGAEIYAIADDGSLHKVGDRKTVPKYGCPAQRYLALVPYVHGPAAWFDPEVMDRDAGISWTPGHFHTEPLYSHPAPLVGSDRDGGVNNKTLSRETLWFCLNRLLCTVEAAIEAGDWKVDGACDPDISIKFSRRALGIDAAMQQTKEAT